MSEVKRRKTWQREAVREALAASEDFVSAQDLHAHMRSAGSPIGLATVYRTLAAFAAAGDADSLHSDGEALYRACSEGHHHHLICRCCGATVEISAEPVEAWARDIAAQHGYVEPDHVVDVFGLCPQCAALQDSGAS